MKNARFFPLSFLLIAWACLAAGCQTSESEPLPVPKKMVSFTVSATQRSADADPASRAVLEANSARWQPDDAIALYAASYGLSGAAQTTLRAETLSDDAKRAVFRGEGEAPAEQDTYYAAYPSDVPVSAERARFEIPAEQAPTAAPQLMMAARSADRVAPGDIALAFEPVNAFLHVTLGEGVTGLTSVELEGVGGETIAGSLTYAFADGQSTLAGDGRKITVSNPTSDFYITLPPVRLARGYRLTFRRGSETMIKCFGYDAGREFRAGGIYTVPAVKSFVPVGADMSGIGTSYDRYLAGDISAANAMDGSTIECNFVIRGISSKLVSAVSLTRNGEALALPAPRADADGIHYEMSLEGQAWQDHEFVLTVNYDGRTETYTRTVSVTGLPYRAAPPTNSGDHPWTKISGGGVSWESSYVHLEGTSAPSIQSPDFHLSGDIGVTVRSNYTKNTHSYFSAHIYSITLAGTGTTVCQHEGKDKGTFDVQGSATFTSSSKAVLCNYDYEARGNSVSVNTVDITYR